MAEVTYEFFLLCFDTYSNITRYENGKDYLVYAFISFAACVILALIKTTLFRNALIVKIDLLAGIIVALCMISYRICGVLNKALANNELSRSGTQY